MKLAHTLLLLTAGVLLNTSVATAEDEAQTIDCTALAKAAFDKAKANPSTAAAIAKSAIKDNPECACEIVKEVIKGAGVENNSASVVAIIKAAIEADSQSMKLICDCALVVSPGSRSAIIAFLDDTYGDDTASGIGLVESPKSGITGAGNNNLIAPIFGGGGGGGGTGGGGGDAGGGGTGGGGDAGGGGGGGGTGGGGGGKPPVGTPGDPAG